MTVTIRRRVCDLIGHSCVIGASGAGWGKRPEGALEGIPGGWASKAFNAGEAFGARCVIDGAGRGRRPEGALEGIPRGSCSGAEQLWVRSDPLTDPPAAYGRGSRRIQVDWGSQLGPRC